MATAGRVALRVTGAGLLAAVGAIHLHLWLAGYRQLPTVGPLFLLDSIVCILLAAWIALRPWWLAAGAGAGVAAATLAGFWWSVELGVFGFRDSLQASFAVTAMAVEIAAVVVLGLLAVPGLLAALHQP
ncbi:MAG: hypothetical protein ACRDYD_09045, partial [Acidimicrobiales bacterium]